MTAYTDIIRLAQQTNPPKIGSQIPAHYVQWAYAEHCAKKNRICPSRNWRDVAVTSGKVIKL